MVLSKARTPVNVMSVSFVLHAEVKAGRGGSGGSRGLTGWGIQEPNRVGIQGPHRVVEPGASQGGRSRGLTGW